MESSTVAKPQHIFPKNKFVAVLWRDPHSLAATETVSEETVDSLHRSLPMISYGYVIKDDPEGISIASEYCGDGDFRNSTFIIRELIVEVIQQSVKKPRKAKSPHATETLHESPGANLSGS